MQHLPEAGRLKRYARIFFTVCMMFYSVSHCGLSLFIYLGKLVLGSIRCFMLLPFQAKTALRQLALVIPKGQARHSNTRMIDNTTQLSPIRCQ